MTSFKLCLLGPPCIEAGDRALAAKDDERVLALHGGGLLAGFALTAAPAFDDWLDARREGVAQRWRAVAERRCDALATAGDVRAALAEASRLIAEDSLQEAHYRRVMTLHHRLGEREAALQVFERCRQALGRELGLRPLPDTLALAETTVLAGLRSPAAGLVAVRAQKAFISFSMRRISGRYGGRNRAMPL